MATYTAGQATVDVLPSMRQFHSTIRRNLKAVTENVEVGVAPAMKGFQEKLKAGVKKMDDTIITIDADIKKAKATIAELEAKKNEATVTVDADVAKAKAKIAELEKKRGTTSIDVDAEISKYRAQIQRLQAQDVRVQLDIEANTAAAKAKLDKLEEDRQAQVTVEADTSAATRSMAEFRALAGRKLRVVVDIDRSKIDEANFAFARMGSLMAKGGIAAAALTGGIHTIGLAGAALAPTVGILAAIPGLMYAGAIAATTLALGAQGIKAAFQGAKGSLDALRASVAATFQRALAPSVANVNAILPQLTGNLNTVAEALSHISNRITGAFRTDGLLSLQSAITNTGILLTRFGDWLAPVGVAFSQFGAASLQALVSLSGGIGNAGERFAAFIARFANVETIQTWIQNAANAFRALWGVIKDLGSIVASVFRAFNDAGVVATGVFGTLTAKVADFFRSIEGQTALREVALALRDMTNAVGAAIKALLPGVSPALQLMADVVASLANALTWAAPAIVGFINFLNNNSGWTAPLIAGLLGLGVAGLALSKLATGLGHVGYALAGLVKAPVWIFKQLQNGFYGLAAAANWMKVAVVPAVRSVALSFWGLLSNPVTWIVVGIVAAIAALVLGIYWLIDNWTTVWNGITTILSWAWNSVIKPVVDALVIAWNAVGGALLWFYNTILAPVFNLIATIFTWLYTYIIGPILGIIVGLLLAWGGIVMFVWTSLIWPALQAIGDFFAFIFGVVIGGVIAGFTAAWNFLAGIFSWVWTAVLWPVLQALGAFFGWVFNSIIMPIVNFFVAAWNALGTAVAWVVNTIVLPVWNALGVALGWVWGNVLHPIFNAIMAVWNAVGTAFNWVWTTIIKPVWDAISGAISWVWDTIINPVFGWIADRCADVGAAFQSMGDTIGGIWDGVKRLVHAGIQGVVDFVWNDGLLGLWRSANDSFLGGIIPDPPGPWIIPGFASGGIVPGYAPGKDTVPAMLSPGEAVLIPEAVKMLGKDKILAWNQQALAGRRPGMASTDKAGNQLFAAGGVAGSGAAGAAAPAAAGAAATAITLSVDPAAVDAMVASVDALTASLAALGAQMTAVTIPMMAQLTLLNGQLALSNATLGLSFVTLQLQQFTAWTAIVTNMLANYALLTAQQLLFQTNQLVSWAAIRLGIVTEANTIYLRELLLQQQFALIWAAISTIVQNSVNAQIAAFETLNAGMAGVRNAMQFTADWAVAQWDRMKAAAADPVRWVIQWPFNAGIIAAWNKLDADFALGKQVSAVPIPFAHGGDVPGRGNRDTVDAQLTPGEYVLSRKAIANMGGIGSVDKMHQMARAGLIGPDARLGNTRADGARRLKLMQTIPLDGLGFAYGGVQPHVAAAGAEVERLFGRLPGGIGGVGSRGNVSDHPSGHALDFMTLRDRPLGDRIAGHLLANGRRLLLKYAIWQQRINEGGGWDPMENRGSITANHMDHVHASFLRWGQAGRDFQGGGMDLGAIVDDYFRHTYDLINEGRGRFPGNRMADMSLDVAKQGADRVKGKALEKLMESMGPGPGGGAEQWRGLVLRALAMMGQPASLVNLVLGRINQESGGNPRAINLWDSNARRGTPSKGLLQTIDPTFQRWRDPSLPNDPFHPLANIIASMRYALGTYGSLQSAYGRKGGYDFGGVARGTGIFRKDTIQPERVLSPAQTRAFDTLVTAISGKTNTADYLATNTTTERGVTINQWVTANERDAQAVAADSSRRIAFSLRTV